MVIISNRRLVIAVLGASMSAPLPLALGLGLGADKGSPIFGLVLTFGIPIAFCHVAFLGMPGFFILAERYRPNWWRLALGGALIGALPLSLLNLLTEFEWIQSVVILLALAACGVVGAVVFWFIIRHALA